MSLSEMRERILLFFIDEECEHEIAEVAFDVDELLSSLDRMVQVSIVNLLSVLLHSLLNSFEQRLKVSLVQLCDNRIQRRVELFLVLQSRNNFGQVLRTLLDRLI